MCPRNVGFFWYMQNNNLKIAIDITITTLLENYFMLNFPML